MHTFNQTAVICVTGMCLFTGAITQAQAQLAKRAEAILRNHCYDCHGLDGTAEGGLNFILDARRMVKRRLVIPGDAVRSKLYRQVKSGSMPKDLDPLTSDDVDTLRKWIDAGAASFSPAARRREFISPFAVLGFIQADLKEIDPNDRPFQRYFTITHLHNAGIPDSELETYRRGLSKLINSLSWAAKIVRPIPIDPTRTVLRIDINDFLWTEETWERIVEENPYGIIFDKPRTGGFTAAAKFCYEATGSPQPFVRADWFVASASIPPLYHDILDLPKTDRELEDRLPAILESLVHRLGCSAVGPDELVDEVPPPAPYMGEGQVLHIEDALPFLTMLLDVEEPRAVLG